MSMSRNGVITRLIIALILYVIPILGLVSGPITPLFGIMAVVELATALTRFSPLYILAENRMKKGEPSTAPLIRPEYN
ncbi:MAG: DUF2892 domain-containing protein [Methylocystaceae bacterium]